MPGRPTRAGNPEDEAGFFDGYVSFAGTLRTWLVAYGVGGPALVLTQKDLATGLLASGKASLVTTLFLVGVGCQVLTALLFKTSMWYLFLGERKPELKSTKRYRVSDWVSEAFWLEAGLDLASILLFGVATYELLRAFKA